MSNNDPNRTVPRTPFAEQGTNDTGAPAAEISCADPNRTADHPHAAPAVHTVARTPLDLARLEEVAQARASEGVPGYVLLRELGRGGMGVVYEARHVKLNRVVALKMMLGGERADRGELIRFLAEAVAAIKHENVVQVYDYGEADGRPFMVLEYCPGGTLKELLPGDRAAALIAQIARGGRGARAGIVHRDLKPGNVFLDASGVPKVADFGLAKRGTGSDVTATGVAMGTPAYMSPEQAKGETKFVGPQADVWALGVMLYEALTGQRPFTGTVQEILAKVRNAEPPPPRKVAPAMPRDLELLCLKCLSKTFMCKYCCPRETADSTGVGRGRRLARLSQNRVVRAQERGPKHRIRAEARAGVVHRGRWQRVVTELCGVRVVWGQAAAR
jgi:eukaryotic-like serine/threonine-protein kinase